MYNVLKRALSWSNKICRPKKGAKFTENLFSSIARCLSSYSTCKISFVFGFGSSKHIFFCENICQADSSFYFFYTHSLLAHSPQLEVLWQQTHSLLFVSTKIFFIFSLLRNIFEFRTRDCKIVGIYVHLPSQD